MMMAEKSALKKMCQINKKKFLRSFSVISFLKQKSKWIAWKLYMYIIFFRWLMLRSDIAISTQQPKVGTASSSKVYKFSLHLMFHRPCYGNEYIFIFSILLLMLVLLLLYIYWMFHVLGFESISVWIYVCVRLCGLMKWELQKDKFIHFEYLIILSTYIQPLYCTLFPRRNL